ncbi:MAG: hypothetical protein K2N23_04845, partial [Clostridia bacterium]|nr:hypothetical protein [Clostridia bacterium]
GGTISGNTADFGGGVYAFGANTFKVSGSPSIIGNNKADDSVNNVYLSGIGNRIIVAGPLTAGAQIGVNNTRTVAIGFTDANNPDNRKPSEYFIIDDSDYNQSQHFNCIYANADGKVYFGTHNTTGVEWSHDETSHWQDCANCGEAQDDEQDFHEFDENGECTVCGYTAVVLDSNNTVLAITATIDGSRYDAWNTNSQKTHSLNLFHNEESVSFLFIRGAETSELYVESDGETQLIENDGAQNTYLISLNVGESKTLIFYCVAEDGSKGEEYTLNMFRYDHSFDGWSMNTTTHWKKCSGCSETANEGAHNFVNASNGVAKSCNVCGYFGCFEVTADNVSTYYNFIADAWAAANEAGTATVTMYADAQISVTLEVEADNDITLDLNGKMLKMTGEGSVISVNGT